MAAFLLIKECAPLHVLVLTFVVGACDMPASPSTTNKAADVQVATSIADIKKKLDTTEFSIQLLERKVDNFFEMQAEITTEPKYALARNSFGIFPVTYNRAVPYLDGHKVYLDIGNPTNIRFVGATIKVNYGAPAPRNTDGKIDFTKWADYRAARKNYETDVTNEFAPGWYTTLELTITPSRPEEVRELEVGVQFNSLKLAGPRPVP